MKVRYRLARRSLRYYLGCAAGVAEYSVKHTYANTHENVLALKHRDALRQMLEDLS